MKPSARPTFRALPAWPYPPQERQPSWFQQVTWGAAVQLLADEVAAIGGDDLLVGIVCDPGALTWDGRFRTRDVPKTSHPGVEVSFDREGGRLTFHTSAFADVRSNVQAIGRGLEALRKVDRYGITSGAEQYAGFRMLPADTKAERGRYIVEQHGGDVRAALKATHPDRQGDPADFDAVRAYQASLGAGS